MNNPARFLALCLFGLFTVGAGPALAQTQTGTIEGTVAGPDGVGLTGAAVKLSGPAVMGTRTATTGETGIFRFPSLPPGGDYLVEVDLAGFQAKRFEHIVVQIGQTTSLPATLAVAGVVGQVTVVSTSPTVDVVSPTASTHFSASLLDNIPNSQRDWEQTVLQAPGIVNGTNENFYGAMYSSRGGSVVSNQASVDGVINTVPVHNINQGSGTVFEAVEEVQVVTGALPAEIGNVGGGYVNVVTKSGGNDVHGEAGIYYEGENLQSDNVGSDLKTSGLTTAKITDFSDWGVNIGGPVIKDKVWFDVAGAHKNLGTAVSGFPFPDSKHEKYFSGKGTWALSPNHTITGVFHYSNWDFPYTGASSLITPEATVDSLFTTRNFLAKWNGVLSNKLLLEANLGVRDSDQANAPQAGAGAAYLDAGTGVISGGNPTYYAISYRRTLPKVAVSFFEPNWMGSHQFKGGVEFENSTGDFRRYGTSPVYLHLLFNGGPLCVATIGPGLPCVGLALFWNQANGVVSNYEMRGLHFFVQDSWSLNSRVTLNLGMRVNTWKGRFPPQSAPAFTYGSGVSFPGASITSTVTALEWSPVEPRLAASIVLDSQARTVLRLGASRYHHGLDMSYFVGSNPNGAFQSTNPWIDFNGNNFADPAEVLSPLAVSVFGGASSPIDPNLRNPYTDEFTIGISHELSANTSLTVNGNFRRDRDLIDDVNASAASNVYVPGPVLDPGVDGKPGTADDKIITVQNQVTNLGAPVLLTITNPSLAKRDYKGFEVIFARRPSHNWQALASLVGQSSTGTLQTNRADASGNSAVFDDPNTLINYSGPLILDVEWQVKMMGTYFAPYGISLSGYYLHETGAPLYRTLQVTLPQGGGAPLKIYADPLDSHRYDSQSRFDLRVEKVFTFTAGIPLHVSVLADVFNLFNAGTVTSRNGDTTSGGGFGFPLAVQSPRTMRIGARVRF